MDVAPWVVHFGFFFKWTGWVNYWVSYGANKGLFTLLRQSRRGLWERWGGWQIMTVDIWFSLKPDKSLNFDLVFKIISILTEKSLNIKVGAKCHFLISQMFANKRNAPTGSSFVFDILYSLKRNRNNVLWEFRNDKKLRKSLVYKFCQADRLVNSDNSTESPILKAIGGGSSE